MRRLASVVATLTLLAVPTFASAQDTEWTRYTLDELGGD